MFSGAVENIVIGATTMVRVAAKNHERVAVVVDPGEYVGILDEFACKAFSRTAAYDTVLASSLTSIAGNAPAAEGTTARISALIL